MLTRSIFSIILISSLVLHNVSVLAQEKTNPYISKKPPNDQLLLKRTESLQLCGDIVEIIGRLSLSENQFMIIGKRETGQWEDMKLMRLDDDRWLLNCEDALRSMRGFVQN